MYFYTKTVHVYAVAFIRVHLYLNIERFNSPICCIWEQHAILSLLPCKTQSIFASIKTCVMYADKQLL